MYTNMTNVFPSIFSYSTCANNNKMGKDAHWSNAWLEAVDDNKVQLKHWLSRLDDKYGYCSKV